jgi:hypothetical protein
MRCPAVTTREQATAAGQPDYYKPQCALDAGHEGAHELVWIVPGTGWPGRPAKAEFVTQETRA